MRVAALSLLAVSLLLVACGESEAPPVANLDFQKQLQTQLIKAKPGEVIEIPAGTWQLDRSLSLKVSGVTLKGAGMDQTILSMPTARTAITLKGRGVPQVCISIRLPR